MVFDVIVTKSAVSLIQSMPNIVLQTQSQIKILSYLSDLVSQQFNMYKQPLVIQQQVLVDL